MVAEWLMSTDHKRIGILYLWRSSPSSRWGSVLGFSIRLSLIAPGWLMGQQTYNEAFTIHGIIQIFLFVIPGIPVAFGNFFLPILIGARTWRSPVSTACPGGFI